MKVWKNIPRKEIEPNRDNKAGCILVVCISVLLILYVIAHITIYFLGGIYGR